MAFGNIFCSLMICIEYSLLIEKIHGQSSESIRIPSSGDNCNVVNLNFGRGEENERQQRGPQGPPGKKGSPGLVDSQGRKGEKGAIGPQGIAPEIDVASITTAVMKTLSASSCTELRNVHDISETGYYLMRSTKSQQPIYNYCDFQLRTDLNTCNALIAHLEKDFKDGYYLMTTSEDQETNFTFCQDKFPTSCQNVSRTDTKSIVASGGVFDIYPKSTKENVEVYCDLETDGGGWTVFQRRIDGSEDFYRVWNDYVNGFGRAGDEFWLGLETIYQLTKNGDHELRVDLTDWSGNTAFAKYGTFSIGNSDDNYRLHVGDFTGTAGDALTYHNGMQFSAKNADHDSYGGNCASTYHGAWWHNNCHYSNLNGPYHQAVGNNPNGMVWKHWKNKYEYLKSAEMKLRKKMN